MNTVIDRPRVDTTTPAATVFQIDPAASRIEFSIGKRLFFVKNLTVTGRFGDVAGTMTVDDQDPVSARVDVTIDAASIDTKNGRRDKHLRTADFFDVDQHPTITFVSHRVEPIDRAEGRYRLLGDLTVRGVTREVALDPHDAPVLGAGHDSRLALTLTTRLNRRDFGINWNNPLMNVADELTVSLAVGLTRN